MPIVLRIDGLRVIIWPNDHRPAHVHVRGAENEAVFILNCPDGPPELRGSYGFRVAEVNRLANLLAIQLATLCRAWETIHGDF